MNSTPPSSAPDSDRTLGRFGFWVGLVAGGGTVGAAAGLSDFLALPPDAVRMLGVALWVGIWWVTEAVPIGATSMLPLALFPLLGIASARETSPAYASPIVLLLLGGFILARMVESTGAHRRVALHVLLTVGTSPRRLVLGFGITAALLSMWISNTATTLIMMPVALAIADRAAPHPERGSDGHRFTLAVLLSTAYGASVGGMGTPVGTPPNLIALAALERSGAETLSFLNWMAVALPAILLIVPTISWMLTRATPGVPVHLDLGARRILEQELTQLGPWRAPELRALAVFGGTALLWVTRPDLEFGPDFRWAGWASRLGLEGTHDSTVAMGAVVLASALPSGAPSGSRLLPWNVAIQVPWGLVFLFGGGIALAVGFEATGLSQALGEGLAGLGSMPWAAFVAAVCLGCTFGTEIISNTALANLAMPIFASTAEALGRSPGALLVPAAMACSCAFMMPTATGPNAIVFGSGRVRVVDMVRAGFLVNWVAWAIIVISALWTYR